MDFWRDDATSSEIRTRIFFALQRAGMSLSIPAQSIFMTLEGRSRKQRKQLEEIERRVAALQRVRILQPLSDSERRELAEQLAVTPFRRGEIITRQGQDAHHLYIIMRGQAEESVAVPPAAEFPGRRVATLAEGDVFGEMGLMTGEPRHATVTALTDVVCYRLDKEEVQGILHRRPEIAQEISHLLAEHKTQLDAIVAGLSAQAKAMRPTIAPSDLLHRIKQFFMLS